MNGALFAEFPPVTTADWEAAIAKDLKGGDPKKLIWKTEDGFEAKPFYRLEDAPGLPAFPDFPKGWRISVEADSADAVNEAIARGAQAVLVRPKNAEELDALLARLPLEKVEIHIRGGAAAASLLAVVDKHAKKLRGSIDAPSQAGNVAFAIETDRLARFEPTATQAVALALAAGSEHLANGVAADRIAFDFAIGGNYFFEIAKLRAARLLWPRVVGAYHAGARPPVRIYAHTGEWNKTVYDPYVNMLRSTTEAMSAVIGGAELVTVTAFNSAFAHPDEFSRRMAINTQLILREEAHFDELSDPASGAWYIDSLADTIAREAWTIFQRIEAAGGLGKATDLIDELVKASTNERQKLIAQRRKLYTGINAHANPKERVLDNMQHEALPSNAAGFEATRLVTEKHEKATGKTPRVFLLRFGDAKMSRARAEFTSDFFACGGFGIVDPPAFPSVDDAVHAIETEKPDLVVLCSSDAEYVALASAVCPKVSCPVIVAGNPTNDIEKLKEAGVADFVHIRSNAIKTLAEWQVELGIKG